MNRRFRLGPVLRARQAQEDVARGAVVQARAEERSAAALVKRRQLDLMGADAPSEGTARAMVASMVARQSLAAGLSAAQRMVGDAEQDTQRKVTELADAAKRRRAVERLAQRHTDALRAHDQAVDQANIDELAVTSRQRAAARGVDAVNERRQNTLRHGSAAQRGAAGQRGAAAQRAELADRVDAMQRAAERTEAGA